MHQDMVVDVRAAGAPRGPVSPPTLVCIRKELETARQVINGLAFRAYDRLDGEGMHDLATAEGLIAGALKKLDAAGVAS